MKIRPEKRNYWEQDYGRVNYKGKKVLDVGADVGSTPDYFLTKGARLVVAVEGDKGFYSQLAENSKIVKGIIPVYLWINKPEHFVQLIKDHQPDVLKVDCEGCEVHLFNVPDDVFSMVPEYIVETHSRKLTQGMKEKCERNNYAIDLFPNWARCPGMLIVYASRSQ